MTSADATDAAAASDNGGPKAPGAPQRPALRSNFDLEPNPFEQSFSSTRASDTSVTTQASLTRSSTEPSRASPPDAVPAAKLPLDTPKPMLPPIAAIASPADNTYAWGLSSADLAGSLRSGPLSPAMLQGPQSSAGHGLSLGVFDPASFPRTGLTPSTGLTPLVGGPVSFPPPSPNTAAFLAMVTNSTTAANLASTTAATITPNTLSAISGVLNNTAIPQQAFAQFGNAANRTGDAYSAANGTDSQVNGLFLLSQAHQELAKREEAQRAGSTTNVSDVSLNGAASSSAPKRGAKRKSIDTPSTAAPSTGVTTRNAGKKPKTTAKSKKMKRDESLSTGDDDDDESYDGDIQILSAPTPSSGKQSKKPETEEEKRRNFLERNRQAALKCRQRKKQWLASLQAKVEFLSTENERLTNALVASREEVSRLTALVGAAGIAGHPPGAANGLPAAPVSVSVSLAQGSKPSVGPDVTHGPPAVLPQAAVVGGGRGYGY